MIVSSDVANILYRDCQVFGIRVYPDGKTPKGEVKAERITIHAKKQDPGTYWEKGFVEVNLSVPDLEDSANSIRLNELERQAKTTLDDVVGEYDGSSYYYSIFSIGRKKDADLKCYYVNVRILFKVLNVK